MNWPITVIDDFDLNVDCLVDYASQLEYKPGARYPGFRSGHLHQLHPTLFYKICIKTIAALFPESYEKKFYKASSFFQKVPANLVDGWVHQDTDEQFTSILYLNKNTNAGTSIYKPIVPHPFMNHEDKQNYFKKVNNGQKISASERKYFLSKRKENNDQFRKTIEVNSEYNRMIIFDGYQYHAAEVYDSDSNEDRLTLITFFHEVFDNDTVTKPNASTCRRII